jgi:hypothetical protein
MRGILVIFVVCFYLMAPAVIAQDEPPPHLIPLPSLPPRHVNTTSARTARVKRPDSSSIPSSPAAALLHHRIGSENARRSNRFQLRHVDNYNNRVWSNQKTKSQDENVMTTNHHNSSIHSQQPRPHPSATTSTAADADKLTPISSARWKTPMDLEAISVGDVVRQLSDELGESSVRVLDSINTVRFPHHGLTD